MAFKLRRPPSLIPKREAYPFQLDAVQAVKTLPYAAIFHEQGLGKTKIAIDLLLCWLNDDAVDTVFVVTKKMLVQNWIDELTIHSHLTPHVLSDDRRNNSIALNSPVLTYVLNYEVVAANADLVREFLRTCRVGVILDESQKIKNPETRLAVCFHSLAAEFERRIIMTGTPSANRPHDVWSQVKFLDFGRALGGSYNEFRDQHDLPGRGQALDVSEYADQLATIMDRIRSFTVRETKETAGLELPGKTIHAHFVELAPRQATMYDAYRDLLACTLQNNLSSAVDEAEVTLKRLLRLVQCASNPGLIDKAYKECPAKIPKLEELVDKVDRTGGKAIVWSQFVDNVEWLAVRLKRYGPQKLHGRMSMEDRNQSVRRFRMDDDSRLLIATPGAAKEGLTLTVASHAIFYDRGFSLDDYLQAQDRIHRISQDSDCFVHNLMARNTVDEWIDTLLNAKHQAARVVHGDLSREDFERTFRGDLADALAGILAPGNMTAAPA